MTRVVSGVEVAERGGVDAVADQIALETGVAHVSGGRVDAFYSPHMDFYRFEAYVLASYWTGEGEPFNA